ncbi:capsule assembly Wzi family protein [Leeuwenhoekiella sp. A16]|uniref:capsule assembly Wzi family protein n=1 Tax=unclassified Leeuwenhoekiella TaxID=2615029 RepID=UPI003A7FA02F
MKAITLYQARSRYFKWDMNLVRVLFLIILCLISYCSQAQLSGEIEGIGILSSEKKNPFWFHANQKGQISEETDAISKVAMDYFLELNEKSSLYVGAGVYYEEGHYNNLVLDELYIEYDYSWLKATFGLKHRKLLLDGLSGVGGDILWSGNSRALPGLQLESNRPIKIFDWLNIEWKLDHYQMNDPRYVNNTRIHHKNIAFDLTLNSNDVLSIGLDHYAQWGGNSPDFGPQPTDFKDFLRIFIGYSGGGSSISTDQRNALGNHLGSYHIDYRINREEYALRFYYQSIFEDRSGRELRNFPDGVWGVYYKSFRKSLFSKILYEYQQTVSQSGRPKLYGGGSISGGDFYFYNGIYKSGWTYFGNSIGTPFIKANTDDYSLLTNRSIIHHFGLGGEVGKLNYLLKISFAENFGTYDQSFELKENAVYSFCQFSYPSRFGEFKVSLGYDYSNRVSNLFGSSLSYVYLF